METGRSLSFRITEDLDAALDELHARDGIGRSEAIRRGLREFLEARGIPFPSYETRKHLREATLAVGGKRGAK